MEQKVDSFARFATGLQTSAQQAGAAGSGAAAATLHQQQPAVKGRQGSKSGARLGATRSGSLGPSADMGRAAAETAAGSSITARLVLQQQHKLGWGEEQQSTASQMLWAGRDYVALVSPNKRWALLIHVLAAFQLNTSPAAESVSQAEPPPTFSDTRC